MPTGHVKIYHPDRKFGFVTGTDGDDLYVHADNAPAGGLRSGDEVSFEVGERDNRAQAVKVEVLREAVTDNPVGRTLSAPPTWDTLEDRDRQRRQNRRRR